MALPIEDYALIGDTSTAALIGRDGSLVWLPLPRFDSCAAFAALLGDSENGHWTIAPAVPPASTTRRYVDDTLVLETTFQTAQGRVRVVDYMPIGCDHPRVIRRVEGESGSVRMHMTFAPRFSYGEVAPWIVAQERSARIIGGPDALALDAPVPLTRVDASLQADFTVRQGEQFTFVLTWYASHTQRPAPIDADAALEHTLAWWRAYVAKCTYVGAYRDAVVRSLIVLKALTYAPTGAIVAAPTTSLPEALGGVRNWDYRYCWLRDAALVLIAFLNVGCRNEAQAFIHWLVRAVAGDPQKLRILYGVGGERLLPESELSFLPGYEHSAPVRIGNAAADQLQLDVYGEVLDAVYHAVENGLEIEPAAREMIVGIVCCAGELAAGTGDHGIWEVRGPRRSFTHSQVMAWVAFDRAVRLIDDHGFPGDRDAFVARRDELHAQTLERGVDVERSTLVQYFGSTEVDASLLVVPVVGFLPPGDPLVAGTVAAIERDLVRMPFVQRYRTGAGDNVDGLPPGEGAFLACSFWLADAYMLLGRRDEAIALFEQLLTLRNDVGLLAEQYDPVTRRLVGNFPQAFSHLSLINTALNLEARTFPSAQRSCRNARRSTV